MPTVTPTLDRASLQGLVQSAGFLDDEKLNILSEVVKKREKQKLMEEADQFVETQGVDKAKMMIGANEEIRTIQKQPQSTTNEALEMLKQIIEQQTQQTGVAPERKKMGIFEETPSSYKTRLEAEKLKKEISGGSVDLGEVSTAMGAIAKLTEEDRKSKEFEQMKPFMDRAFKRSGLGSTDGLSTSQAEAAAEKVGFDPEIKNISPAGATLDFDTQKEIVQRSMDIGKEFIKDKVVDEYRTVSTQVGIMDNLLSRALQGNEESMAGIDQALITTFNKINDPMSVVRESEYARTEAGMALVRRLDSAYQKINKGGSLNNAERKDLVNMAKIIANSRGKEFNKAYDRYDSITKKSRGDREVVFGDMQKHKDVPVGGKPTRYFSESTGKYYDADGNEVK